MLVNFTRGLAPSLIAPLEINRAADRASDPAADAAGRHPRLAGRQRPARGGPAARPDHAARAGRAALLAGHARPLRRDARGPGADRRAQPPRDRLAARAGRRGRAAPPPREEPPVPALSVRPQPDDVHRPARGRQLLRRTQRRPEQQRLADGHRARRGLAAPERRGRQRRADPPAPRRARPGLDRVHPDGLPGPVGGLAVPRSAPDRPDPRGRDRGGRAAVGRVGRQELHRPARDRPVPPASCSA